MQDRHNVTAPDSASPRFNYPIVPTYHYSPPTALYPSRDQTPDIYPLDSASVSTPQIHGQIPLLRTVGVNNSGVRNPLGDNASNFSSESWATAARGTSSKSNASASVKYESRSPPLVKVDKVEFGMPKMRDASGLCDNEQSPHWTWDGLGTQGAGHDAAAATSLEFAQASQQSNIAKPTRGLAAQQASSKDPTQAVAGHTTNAADDHFLRIPSSSSSRLGRISDGDRISELQFLQSFSAAAPFQRDFNRYRDSLRTSISSPSASSGSTFGERSSSNSAFDLPSVSRTSNESPWEIPSTTLSHNSYSSAEVPTASQGQDAATAIQRDTTSAPPPGVPPRSPERRTSSDGGAATPSSSSSKPSFLSSKLVTAMSSGLLTRAIDSLNVQSSSLSVPQQSSPQVPSADQHVFDTGSLSYAVRSTPGNRDVLDTRVHEPGINTYVVSGGAPRSNANQIPAGPQTPAQMAAHLDRVLSPRSPPVVTDDVYVRFTPAAVLDMGPASRLDAVRARVPPADTHAPSHAHAHAHAHAHVHSTQSRFPTAVHSSSSPGVPPLPRQAPSPQNAPASISIVPNALSSISLPHALRSSAISQDSVGSDHDFSVRSASPTVMLTEHSPGGDRAMHHMHGAMPEAPALPPHTVPEYQGDHLAPSHDRFSILAGSVLAGSAAVSETPSAATGGASASHLLSLHQHQVAGSASHGGGGAAAGGMSSGPRGSTAWGRGTSDLERKVTEKDRALEEADIKVRRLEKEAEAGREALKRQQELVNLAKTGKELLEEASVKQNRLQKGWDDAKAQVAQLVKENQEIKHLLLTEVTRRDTGANPHESMQIATLQANVDAAVLSRDQAKRDLASVQAHVALMLEKSVQVNRKNEILHSGVEELARNLSDIHAQHRDCLADLQHITRGVEARRVAESVSAPMHDRLDARHQDELTQTLVAELQHVLVQREAALEEFQSKYSALQQEVVSMTEAITAFSYDASNGVSSQSALVADLQNRISGLEVDLARKSQDVRDLKVLSEEVCKSRDKVIMELAESKSSLSAVKHEYGELEKRYAQAQQKEDAQHDKLEAQLAKERTGGGELRQLCDDLRKSVEAAQKGWDGAKHELEVAVSERLTERGQYEEAQQRLEAERDAAQAERDAARGRCEDALQRLEGAQKERDAIRTHYDDVHKSLLAENRAIREQLEELRHKYADATIDGDAVRAGYDDMRKELEQVHRDRDGLRQACGVAEQRADEIRKQLEQSIKDKVDLADEREELRVKLESAKEEGEARVRDERMRLMAKIESAAVERDELIRTVERFRQLTIEQARREDEIRLERDEARSDLAAVRALRREAFDISVERVHSSPSVHSIFDAGRPEWDDAREMHDTVLRLEREVVHWRDEAGRSQELVVELSQQKEECVHLRRTLADKTASMQRQYREAEVLRKELEFAQRTSFEQAEAMAQMKKLLQAKGVHDNHDRSSLGATGWEGNSDQFRTPTKGCRASDLL